MSVKRIFDAFSSLVLLTALSPLFAFISACIKLTDGGGVFYRGQRVGLGGRTFRIFKFRTMVVDAEKMGGASTASEDSRITRIGSILRKYKIDELPQLINVLIGHMSLVGPRPEVKYYTDMYSEAEKAILSIKPGITDWASIWNADEGAVLAGAEDPEKAYETLIRPTKLKLQMKYVQERSFWVDIRILCLTVLAVIRPGSKALQEIRTQ